MKGITFLNHSYFNLFGNFHYEYKLSILLPACKFSTASRQIRQAARVGFEIKCLVSFWGTSITLLYNLNFKPL